LFINVQSQKHNCQLRSQH